MTPPTWELLADRVWLAYNCLPRDKWGKLPSYRSLEKPVNLTNGVLQETIHGSRKRPGPENMVKLAAALRCDLQWLMTGKGPAPSTSYPFPPRPQNTERPARAAALKTVGVDPSTTERVKSLLDTSEPDVVEPKRQKRR